jgi:radical SAM superfamily enzyme YgiQ (UPF0313 family)
VFDLQIPAFQSRWEKDLVAFQPGLIGITAMTPSIGAARRVAEACKALLPDVPIVLGGYHVSFLPEDALGGTPAFDMAVIGEGEVTLHELVETLESGGDVTQIAGMVLRDGDRLVPTGPRERLEDLDSLPMPHEHYDLHHYLWHGGYSGRWTFKCASAIVSRGCPFQCRFCASRRFWSRRYLLCSPERAVDEMAWLARHGARSVYFRDSTFNVKKRWVEEFCEAKRKKGLKTRWICNSRADTIDDDHLAMMADAGLEAVYFGVESGSQRVLDAYGKGTSVEQIRDAFDICHRHGVATAAYFMIGAPNETREDIELSRKLARELNARYTYWFIYSPLPGCEMYDDFLGLGFQPDFENQMFSRASIPVGDMSCEELEAIHHELVREFQRIPSRADVWRRRLEMLRGVRTWRDVRHLGGRLARRLGLGGRG